MIDSFCKNADCLNGLADLDAELQALKAAGTLTAEVRDVLLTLVALFILQEKFEEREDEWTLIAKKAKTWLKQVGLAKPDKFLTSINLGIK